MYGNNAGGANVCSKEKEGVVHRYTRFVLTQVWIFIGREWWCSSLGTTGTFKIPCRIRTCPINVLACIDIQD